MLHKLVLDSLIIKVKVEVGRKKLEAQVKTDGQEKGRLGQKSMVVQVKMDEQEMGRLKDLAVELDLARLRLRNLGCHSRRSCQMSCYRGDDDVRDLCDCCGEMIRAILLPHVDGDDGDDDRHFCSAKALCSANFSSRHRQLGTGSKCGAPKLHSISPFSNGARCSCPSSLKDRGCLKRSLVQARQRLAQLL